MKHIKGISASGGIALGTARYLRHSNSGLGRAVGRPQQEQETLEDAVRQAQGQLARLEHAARQDSDIYMVQRILLEDDALRQEIASYIEVGAPAASAVERAAGIFAQRIRALEDPYMRERACDILDACRRVVKILDDQPHETLRLNGPAILVAEELYPTDIAMLDRSMVMGILTSAGSPDAHAAIIARTMGIPAVVMTGPELPETCDGQMLALDGDAGEAYLEPDEATRQRFSQRLQQLRRVAVTRERLSAMPCRTRDGTAVTLLADCASPEDVRGAVAAGADGVGLLLGEYRLAPHADDEEAQYRFYRECCEAAAGRTVTACVFDAQREYPAPERLLASQANPALGLQGTRWCLTRPELFEAQLCAMLRAGRCGSLRIILPMVSSREELERALDAVEHAKAALRARGADFAENTAVGVLLQTPAAMLMAQELSRRAALFCVDADCLTQYTFAADRANPQMRAYLPDESPAIYRLLRFAVEAAEQAHIPLGICGEKAARPALAETYVRTGVRAFSLPVRELLAVKEYLMGVTL